uniref:Uncharacterized protein n=1 Tax=Arundo donax TaxID=35708 RepID=A0A0A9DSV8_ARUDO
MSEPQEIIASHFARYACRDWQCSINAEAYAGDGSMQIDTGQMRLLR